jgi:hypothetical protein
VQGDRDDAMTSKRRKVDDLSAAQLCRFGLALARFIDGKFPSAVSIAEGLAEGLGRSQGRQADKRNCEAFGWQWPTCWR